MMESAASNKRNFNADATNEERDVLEHNTNKANID